MTKKHFGKLSGHISVIKTINLLKLPILKTILLNLKTLIINTTDDIQSLTKNYENHFSVRKIKEVYPEIVPDSFHFKSVSLDDVKNEVLNLNPKKSSTSGTILVTILKQTIDVHLQNLTNAKNHTLQTNCFPDKLKQSELVPVYKKLDPSKSKKKL